MDTSVRPAEDRDSTTGLAAIRQRLAAADYLGAAAASYRLAIESPTITSWGSIVARSASVFFVLPLLLRNFSTAEISLWYLFASVTSIQFIITAPLVMTFARFVAFAVGGASAAEIRDLRVAEGARDGGPNLATLSEVWESMRRFYRWLGLAPIVLLGTAGSLGVWRPVSLLADPAQGWMAWAIVVTVAAVIVWGDQYSAFMQGLDRIAEVKRWEMLTSAASIATAAIALAFGARLLEIVAVTQGWQVVNVFVVRALCRRNALFGEAAAPRTSHGGHVLSAVRSSAWRSAVGTFMAAGTLQLSNIAYAQVAPAASLASYLLAFNLMASSRLLANAPFYSKIPRMARLRAAGDLVTQQRLAASSMAMVYWVFVLLFAVIGIAAPFLLQLIRSNTPFVAIEIWILLGIAFFLERFGAMHLQLYTTTNHVVWHIVNGVSGAIFVIAAAALFPWIGVQAIPVGLIVGYAGFFVWYPARLSYRALGTSFRIFDAKVVLPPLAAFVLSIAVLLAIR